MAKPLAERLRPRTLDEYIGQQHLVGKNAVLRNMLESGRVSSFILWGPPGVGKTTLALIVANQLKVPFYTLSAVSSGVKDVREVLDKANIRGSSTAGAPSSSSTRFTGSAKTSRILSLLPLSRAW